MAKKSKIEYHDIVLTDLEIHAVKPTNPAPWYRVIMKSLRNKLSGRIYSKNIRKNVDGKNNAAPFNFAISLSEDLKEKIAGIEKLGKEVRFLMPKEGIPIYVGKDLQEFMKARKNRLIKRI